MATNNLDLNRWALIPFNHQLFSDDVTDFFNSASALSLSKSLDDVYKLSITPGAILANTGTKDSPSLVQEGLKTGTASSARERANTLRSALLSPAFWNICLAGAETNQAQTELAQLRQVFMAEGLLINHRISDLMVLLEKSKNLDAAICVQRKAWERFVKSHPVSAKLNYDYTVYLDKMDESSRGFRAVILDALQVQLDCACKSDSGQAINLIGQHKLKIASLMSPANKSLQLARFDGIEGDILSHLKPDDLTDIVYATISFGDLNQCRRMSTTLSSLSSIIDIDSERQSIIFSCLKDLPRRAFQEFFFWQRLYRNAPPKDLVASLLRVEYFERVLFDKVGMTVGRAEKHLDKLDDAENNIKAHIITFKALKPGWVVKILDKIFGIDTEELHFAVIQHLKSEVQHLNNLRVKIIEPLVEISVASGVDFNSDSNNALNSLINRIEGRVADARGSTAHVKIVDCKERLLQASAKSEIANNPTAMTQPIFKPEIKDKVINQSEKLSSQALLERTLVELEGGKKLPLKQLQTIGALARTLGLSSGDIYGDIKLRIDLIVASSMASIESLLDEPLLQKESLSTLKQQVMVIKAFSKNDAYVDLQKKAKVLHCRSYRTLGEEGLVVAKPALILHAMIANEQDANETTVLLESLHRFTGKSCQGLTNLIQDGAIKRANEIEDDLYLASRGEGNQLSHSIKEIFDFCSEYLLSKQQINAFDIDVIEQKAKDSVTSGSLNVDSLQGHMKRLFTPAVSNSIFGISKNKVAEIKDAKLRLHVFELMSFLFKAERRLSDAKSPADARCVLQSVISYAGHWLRAPCVPETFSSAAVSRFSALPLEVDFEALKPFATESSDQSQALVSVCV